MSNYNPDYPVANGGSFSQHIYSQPTAVDSSFYYSGMGTFPSFPSSTFQPDSRRNDGYNQMPQNPTPQYPMTFNTLVPTTFPSSEQNIQPFSSYPPSTPQMGLNSMVESRRFSQPQTSAGSNPWAAPQQTQATTFPPVQTTQSFPSWPVPNDIYADPNCAALYSNQSFGFDRSEGNWNNMYSVPKQIAPPIIDWSKPVQAQPTVYATPTYPTFVQPQQPTSWKDMADRNWGGSSF